MFFDEFIDKMPYDAESQKGNQETENADKNDLCRFGKFKIIGEKGS